MTEKKYKDKISILIELFIKKPVNWDKKKFQQEMVAFAKLVKTYPDFEFFYHLPEYTDKFNSFWGFQNGSIKTEMINKYKEFLINKEKNKEIILEIEPVIKIELDKTDKKPQNVLEFIK